MYINIIIVVLSSIFFIYFFNLFAKKIGLVDFPDARKLHKGFIPLVGGIAIYSSIFIFYFLIEISLLQNVILISSLILLIVGVFDDIHKLGVLERFFFQILSCLIVIGFGLTIVDFDNLFKVNILNKELVILFTFLCVIGLTNAINFIDGIDGLAAGIILNALISILIFSYFENSTTDLDLVLLLIVSIVIFSFANLGIFLPKIFLGDSGSTALGFLLAFLLVYYTHPDIRNFHPVLTVWCVAIPTYDFMSVFIRRILKGINPFKPDRRHLHHLLISKGFNHIKVSVFIVTSSFFLSTLGYIVYKFYNPLYSLLVFFFLFILFLFFSIYISRLED